jgi:CPA2 family monovalent cation:H+ antiporter-2
VQLDSFLLEAIAVLGTAVAMVFLSARLRVPTVVGLIITGFVIGPFGLALVHEVERVEVFAEIGVVLLLFIIGLELNTTQLRHLSRPLLIGGSAQALITVIAASALAVWWAPSARGALFAGMVVALSSTAVVLKLYDERREIRTPQGRAVLGILLFQDLLIVPFIVLTPVLAGRADASVPQLLLRFGGALAAIAGIVLAAWFLMPYVLHQVVRVRVRELFVMTGLVSCLSLAWLTHSLGLSMALGAFLAGILVSESEYSHQIVADILPFRDVFASLFFVSIGMLVDLGFARENLGMLLALTALVIAIKVFGAGTAVRLLGYPFRIALLAGFSLAQIGEFSFVLMEVGAEHGLLAPRGFQTLLTVAVLTLLATPLLIRIGPPLAQRLTSQTGSRRSIDPAAADDGLVAHVIVVGYGVSGSLLCKVLSEAHIRYVVIDVNPEIVRSAQREGVPIRFGDATRLEILQRAGVERAQVVVFAISDVRAVIRGLRMARQENRSAALLVRTPQVKEIPELRAAGASEVIAEEFESAIAIFTRVLEHYHVPRNVVRAQNRALRGDAYRLLRASEPGSAVSEAVLATLQQGTADLYRVAETSRAVGCSLRALELRRITGASVIAVIRDQESFPNPSPDLELAAGDQLVLVGDHQQVEQAFEYLDEQTIGQPGTRS